MIVSKETVILGTLLRLLKTKPIVLTVTSKMGHVQLLNEIARGLQVEPHRCAGTTHERIFRELLSRPRDIHIAGAHHLTSMALELLLDLWDETKLTGPRKAIRIVMCGKNGFVRRIASRHPQLAERVIVPFG